MEPPGVGDESRGQTIVRLRAIGVIRQTDRHDDGRTTDLAPIFQRDEEMVPLAFDRRHISLIDAGHGVLLEPETIFNESVSGDGIAFVVNFGLSEEALKPILPMWIREVRGPPVCP